MLAECKNDEDKRKMLTFQDCDLNTALHFGARAGNYKICSSIIDAVTNVNCQIEEMRQIDLVNTLVNCRNSKGFTPLIEVCFRGFKTQSEKENASESRHKIITKLIDAGANTEYCKRTT